jgi:cytochrome c peroxidase
MFKRALGYGRIVACKPRMNSIKPNTSYRFYSEQAPKRSSSFRFGLILATTAVGITSVLYYYKNSRKPCRALKTALPPAEYFEKAVGDIAKLIGSAESYDDGSYGPLFVRLAWHASGTYDKNTNSGGSNGATMRFEPESADGANAGLALARDLLEPIKEKYPKISYADLWTLAGVVAIKEMGGPSIPWHPGRRDIVENEVSVRVPPNGRLPDAAKKEDHIRQVFGRMGFDDQEMVALIGAHALGRCHTDRSGFTGPWTRSPTTFSNNYFQLLLNTKWTEKKWEGPKQFEDPTGELMMLPSDLALVEDSNFSKYVHLYAKDEELFFSDFSKAFQKLVELGVPFPENTPEIKV